jgi:hypothetical protein
MAQQLAYRIRAAEERDLPVLRDAITVSLAHPDGRVRKSVSRAALQRNELLVLEHYDHRERQWVIGGFIEWHLRVDDALTIKDVASVGEVPHSGIVKHLVNELFVSYRPVGATLVVRRDAEVWNEIVAAIPGFSIEGPPEYRRPHYFNIWKWSPTLARQSQRQPSRGNQPNRGGRR